MHQLEPKSTEFPHTLDTLEPPTLRNWCPGAESNHRHGDFQSPALPTELPGPKARGRVCMPRSDGPVKVEGRRRPPGTGTRSPPHGSARGGRTKMVEQPFRRDQPGHAKSTTAPRIRCL